MFMTGKTGPHMVNIASNFCATSYLRTQSRKYIDCGIRAMWTLLYIFPAYLLSVDQGSTYLRYDMRQNLEADGMNIIQAAIENPGKIGVVEGFHAPLRVAFMKIQADFDRTTSAQIVLTWRILRELYGWSRRSLADPF